jgi:hypothetical protein
MLLSLLTVFRQSSYRDDRRRRLLVEDVSGLGVNRQSALPSKDESKPSKPDHYGDGEFLDELPRLIDYLPRSLLCLLFVELIGIASLAGLAGLYFWSLEHLDLFPKSVGNVLDLSGPGTLGAWASTLFLLASIFTALAIYSIRRHRSDDYQGRYRIWLWAALGLFLFATDLNVGLHSLFQQMLVRWTGTSLWGGGELWWMIPAALLFAALGSRVLVDLWPCKPAAAWHIGCSVCYLISMLASLQILVSSDPRHQALLQHGTALLGHFFLLTALLHQVRYVRLDAEGLIRHPLPATPVKEESEKESTKVAVPSAAHADQFLRVDSPQGIPQPILRRTAPAPSPQSAPVPGVQRKLTKMEKKALREKLLRERLQREGKW